MSLEPREVELSVQGRVYDRPRVLSVGKVVELIGLRASGNGAAGGRPIDPVAHFTPRFCGESSWSMQKQRAWACLGLPGPWVEVELAADGVHPKHQQFLILPSD